MAAPPANKLSKEHELNPLVPDEEAVLPDEEAAKLHERELARKRRVVRRLVSTAAEARRLMVCGGVAVVVSSGLDSLQPLFAGQTLSAVVTQDGPTFTAGLTGLLVTGALACAVSGLRVYCTALIEVRLVERLRARLLASMLRQDTAFFDVCSSGELVSRLTSDVTLLSSSLTTNFNLIMQSSVNLVTTVIVSTFWWCSLSTKIVPLT